MIKIKPFILALLLAGLTPSVLALTVKISNQGPNPTPGSASNDFIKSDLFQDNHSKDNSKDLKILELAANQGNPEAEFILGHLYNDVVEGSIPEIVKDDEQALIWYQKSAEQGYAPAEFWMGFMS